MKDKDIKNIIDNIEEHKQSDAEVLMIGNFAESFKDRSEDDIFVEIIRVKDEMEDQISEEQYETILSKLDSIRPMLNEEQNGKLDKVLEILNKNRI